MWPEGTEKNIISIFLWLEAEVFKPQAIFPLLYSTMFFYLVLKSPKYLLNLQKACTRQWSNRLKCFKVNLHLQVLRCHWRNPNGKTSFMWPACRHVTRLKYTEFLLLVAALLSLSLSLHTYLFSLICFPAKSIWCHWKSVLCIRFHVLFCRPSLPSAANNKTNPEAWPT